MLVRLRDDSARVLVPAAEVGRSPIPTYVAWSDDGRTVSYLAVDAAHGAGIWAVPRSGGAPRLVVRFDDPTRQWHRFGFIQRGGRFYFTLGDRQSDIWMSEVTKLGG